MEDDKPRIPYEFITFFQNYSIFKTNIKTLTLTCFALAFILLGLGIAAIADQKLAVDYKFAINENCLYQTCPFIFHLDVDPLKPLYFFVGFENFSMNHLKVLSSKDNNQLSGASLKQSELGTGCKGYSTVKDARRFYPNFQPNRNTSDPITPCGLAPLLYSHCKMIRFNHPLSLERADKLDQQHEQPPERNGRNESRQLHE